MDYYSVLGPIDPQIEGPDGKLIPALGYLLKYEELLKKTNEGEISAAEMEILLNFDQGQLYSYEQARDLSKSLLEEWLCNYKFKDWNETETSKQKVDDQMKRVRAKEIADDLNNVQKWNSHGIGINLGQIEDDLKLRIDDFGKDEDVLQAVRGYHKLLIDYVGKMGFRSVVHSRHAFRPF